MFIANFIIFKLLNYVFLTLALGLYMTGCVSIKMAPDYKWIKASVEYVSPKAPFEPFESAHIDKAWKSTSSGNSISYLTECNSKVDPSLDNIHRGLLYEFEGPQVLTKELLTYNDRGAIKSQIKGHIDGVLSQVEFVIFKKNGCSYILTYVGLVNNFQEDYKIFEEFLKGFQAP